MLLLWLGTIQHSLLRPAAKKAVPHTCGALWGGIKHGQNC
jgi:hypothetical protein